jgi:hypothetical protein
MKTLHCPAAIEFLLHCHSSPEPWPRMDAPVYLDLVPRLLEAGVIELDKRGHPSVLRSSYQTTPLGKAWVEALCRVPMPRAVFVDERGEILGNASP